MEMKFSQQRCAYQKALLDQVTRTELTQELRLSDAMPDIGRIVGCWGQTVLRGKEWRTGSVGINGGISAYICYEPEDQTEVRGLELWIPFQQRWEIPQTDGEGFILPIPKMTSMDARMVSARKIMVRANLSTWIRAFVREEGQIPTPIEAPEDIQLLSVEYPLMLPVDSGEKLVYLDEEINLPADAGQILRQHYEPVVQEQRLIANRLVFKGTGNLHLLYLSGEDVKAYHTQIPFSQYMDMEGELSGSAVTDLIPVVTEVETEISEGSMRLKGQIAVQYILYDRQNVSLCQDAYSPVRSVSARTELLELPACLDSSIQQIRMNQTIRTGDGKVVDVCALTDHPQQRGSELELSGTLQVLQRDAQNKLQWNTVRFDVSEPMEVDETAKCAAFLSSGGDLSVMDGGEEKTLSGTWTMDVRCQCQQGIPMMTAAEFGEASQPDSVRPSLLICRCGEDGLWALAKRCGSTVDAIRQANGLQSEPESDRLLLVPVL